MNARASFFSLPLVGRVGRVAARVGVTSVRAALPPTGQAWLADLPRKGGGKDRREAAS